MRMAYRDALAALVRRGKAAGDLLEAIGTGEIEVSCRSMTVFDFCLSDYEFSHFEANALIYIDPLLLDRKSGVVQIEEIKQLSDGFHRSALAPFWHVHKRDDNFTLYVCAHEGIKNTGPLILALDFLKDAELLADNSAFVDDIDVLQRRHAHDVTLDARDFAQFFKTHRIENILPQSPIGRPSLYSDVVCDAEFRNWFRTSPQASKDMRIFMLKEIYKKAGHKVGSDETAKVEKRKIAALLTQLGPIDRT